MNGFSKYCVSAISAKIRRPSDETDARPSMVTEHAHVSVCLIINFSSIQSNLASYLFSTLVLTIQSGYNVDSVIILTSMNIPT